MVFKFILKTFVLCTTLCTFNWYISLISWCTKLIYFFLQLVSTFWLDFTPHWFFLFKTKRGRILFSLTPLLMIDKKREKYLSLYACIWVYMHIYCLYKIKFLLITFQLVSRVFYWLVSKAFIAFIDEIFNCNFYWSQKHVYFRYFLLVSRACLFHYACLCIFMFSIQCISYYLLLCMS